MPSLPTGRGGRRIIYFPTCLTRTLGSLPGEKAPPLAQAMIEVLEWAGFAPAYPDGISSRCCGMPFSSKAFTEAGDRLRSQTLSALRAASRDGADIVVTDASPCAARLADEAARVDPTLRVLDFPTFWAREVLPRRDTVPRVAGTAVLHPTCSLVKAGGLADLVAVARAHAEHVLVPDAAECCGFAGDRGFFVPALTEEATRAEAAEVHSTVANDARLFSTCRTCEIGMTRAVGRPYSSLVALVHEAIRA
jgi:D-lactate dehydrogenase